MKKIRFDVPFYNFKVVVAQIEGSSDYNEVRRLLRWMKCSDEDMSDVLGAVERGAVNGGETFRDMRLKQILVLYYPFDNEDRRYEVYSHEKRHVEDRLLEWNNIHDIESAGMLSGYLGIQWHKFEML